METGLLILLIIGIIIVLVIVIALVMRILAKMKGKIEIVLDNYNYSAGDTISGKINLTIKKPVKSNALTIRLIGERDDTSYKNGRSNTSVRNIFDFKQPIEGEKEYQPCPELSYDFKLKFPTNINTKLEGVLGAVVKTAQILGGTNSQIKWFLIADLDIAGVDISKKVQINIS